MNMTVQHGRFQYIYDGCTVTFRIRRLLLENVEFFSFSIFYYYEHTVY